MCHQNKHVRFFEKMSFSQPRGGHTFNVKLKNNCQALVRWLPCASWPGSPTPWSGQTVNLMAVRDSELGGTVRLEAEQWDRGRLDQHRCDDKVSYTFGVVDLCLSKPVLMLPVRPHI